MPLSPHTGMWTFKVVEKFKKSEITEWTHLNEYIGARCWTYAFSRMAVIGTKAIKWTEHCLALVTNTFVGHFD